MTWRPFRARRPGGRFPGLKPWAKSCSPSGAINYPKSCSSSCHSVHIKRGRYKLPTLCHPVLAEQLPKYISHAFGSLDKPWKPGYLRSA